MAPLREQFPVRVISRFGDTQWPARSPDLSPLDYFLCGKVYRVNPKTISELKDAILSEIRLITKDNRRAVMANMKKRTECSYKAGRCQLKDYVSQQ